MPNLSTLSTRIIRPTASIAIVMAALFAMTLVASPVAAQVDVCSNPDFLGFPCSTGNPCIFNEQCLSNRTCGGGTPSPPPTPCDDGNFCNGADACNGAGSCVSAGDPCAGPDGDANCRESCDEATDSCTAIDPDDSICADANECTSAGQCFAGSCLTLDVSNGTPCTSDGAFCTGVEVCQSGSCVSPGDPCGGPDGDGECSESCDENAGACTAPDPDGTACDDNIFCNGGADTCQSGVCAVHAGDPCAGPDGDGECSESCDENANNCTAPDPDGSACDDGVFCNGVDACQAGACVIPGPGNPCPGPDQDANCSESCNEVGQSCNAPDPDTLTCQDGEVLGLLVEFSGVLPFDGLGFDAGDVLEGQAEFVGPATPFFGRHGATAQYVPGTKELLVNGSPIAIGQALLYTDGSGTVSSCLQIAQYLALCANVDLSDPPSDTGDFFDAFPVAHNSPGVVSSNVVLDTGFEARPLAERTWSISLAEEELPAPVPALTGRGHLLLSILLLSIASFTLLGPGRASES